MDSLDIVLVFEGNIFKRIEPIMWPKAAWWMEEYFF